jgi:hypothetical protein
MIKATLEFLDDPDDMMLEDHKPGEQAAHWGSSLPAAPPIARLRRSTALASSPAGKSYPSFSTSGAYNVYHLISIAMCMSPA